MFLYNIGIKLYYFAAWLASFFNAKANLWILGRKNQNIASFNSSIWFHFASLGEFEQGRPILEAVRELHRDKKIVVTFFSPSGYQVRKDTPLADAVYYLPLDTAKNARHFVAAIKPEMAIFTKYEYWYHYFNELHREAIPLYVISGIFRPEQIFFKWYGGLHRKVLSFVTRFFLQDKQSEQLLHQIGITNTTISGDTRFDRVWANARQPKPVPLINEFKNGQKLFIVGSTWPEDERLLAALPALYPEWKFIFAPHEISEEKINNLVNLLPEGSAISYSELEGQRTKDKGLRTEEIYQTKDKGLRTEEIHQTKDKGQRTEEIHQTKDKGLRTGENQAFITPDSRTPLTTPAPRTPHSATDPLPQTLIIDNIGMLSSLYAYGDIAYIGGGFGAGIHNTLEAAAFGLPVIFGPNYLKFNEARELIALKAGFSIGSLAQLTGITDTLITDGAFYSITGKKIQQYVQEHTGATLMIMNHINETGFH